MGKSVMTIMVDKILALKKTHLCFIVTISVKTLMERGFLRQAKSLFICDTEAIMTGRSS